MIPIVKFIGKGLEIRLMMRLARETGISMKMLIQWPITRILHFTQDMDGSMEFCLVRQIPGLSYINRKCDLAGITGKQNGSALLSCLVLNQAYSDDWKPVFNGLHILMGYDTPGLEGENQGSQFARRRLGEEYIRRHFRYVTPGGKRSRIQYVSNLSEVRICGRNQAEMITLRDLAYSGNR